MRFFKSFKLLHRRTKSEPSNSLVSGISTLPGTAPSSSNLPSIFSTVAPDVLHPNIRILDLEKENMQLRNLSANVVEELSIVKSQLIATQADLFAELHKSARQHQDAQKEIRRLCETVVQYEAFIIHVASSTDHPVAFDSSRVVDQVLSNVTERGNTSLMTASTNMSTAYGIRTLDDYKSAIQLTLKSRLQLRQSRKIAKFWKKAVQTELGTETLVTPSASTISSILEVPPPDRQKAVEELIARRCASKLYSVSTPVDASQRPKVEPILTPTSLPRSAEVLSVVRAQHVPKSFKAGTLSTSRSLPQARPYLSPLASQSLKQELDRFLPSSRLAHRHHISRQPLEQLDLNVRSCNPLEHKPILHVATSIPLPHHRKPATQISSATDQSQRNSMVVQTRQAATQTSLQPVDHGIGTRPVTQGLSEIREEAEYRSDSSLSSNDTSQGWVQCHIQDTSFGSNTETLIPATPTIPTVKKLARTKSKIPLPVFKTFRRLSSTRLRTTKQTEGMLATPAKKPKSTGVSFAQIPVNGRLK